MKVKLTYNDNDSLLVEEVIKTAHQNYGERIQVEVEPESSTPMDYLYFALQRLITGDQITLLYESGAAYPKDLTALRAETLYKVGEVLDDVFSDNEHKIT